MYAAPRYFAKGYFGGIWPYLSEGAQDILPVGFEQGVVFGTPALGLQVRPAGFEQIFEFGTPSLGLEVRPDGFVQPAEFGTPELALEIQADGTIQVVEFGTPAIGLELRPAGFIQGIEFGIPEVKFELFIRPAGISQPIDVGTPDVVREGLVKPLGISQYIRFGTPNILVQKPFLEFTARAIEPEEFAIIRSRAAEALIHIKQLAADTGLFTSSSRAEPPVHVRQLVANTEISTSSRAVEPPVHIRQLASNTEISASSTEGNKMAKVIKVIVKQDTTGQLIATNPATIDTLPVPPSTRLDNLTDVNAAGEVEGGVPRYDVGTDKYVVEKLGFSDLTGDPGEMGIDEIDGGSF